VKRISFLTGTRADFGKLKNLIRLVDDDSRFDCHVIVTGMHMLKLYGLSSIEIDKQNYSNVFKMFNQRAGDPMEQVLANTIIGLSKYFNENPCDLIVIHGDRVEALAGAIVGALTNTRVCHIEGGELSGTVDELIRHSVSKLSHSHLVANEQARNRLLQMGEAPNSIFVIGSPEIDLMLSPDLPSLSSVKKHYDIPFEEYAIATLHPVTTEIGEISSIANRFTKALVESRKKYVVIYPNNDEGSNYIIEELEKLNGNPNFKIHASLRFEAYLTLMKNAKFLIGNSSSGVREAPVYGTPSVNVGSRQHNRALADCVINTSYETKDILKAIATTERFAQKVPSFHYGRGRSKELFLEVLLNPDYWTLPVQKQFIDVNIKWPE